MPCHNEGQYIHWNIAETASILESAVGDNFEILVIDDGSLDQSFLQAKRMEDLFPNVEVLGYRKNQGKGFALKYGFERSTGDLVCFLDGDLDLPPVLIPRFLNYLHSARADAVVGSKRHPLSRVQYPKRRNFLSVAYNRLARTLFHLPLKDTQVGLKVFRREALEEAFPRVLVKRFAFDLELLVNLHDLGYRIVEAPVELKYREGNGSDVSPKAVWEILVDTLAIFYRARLVNYYSRVIRGNGGGNGSTVADGGTPEEKGARREN
jgi:glycosyltransferase involved in cell wall biosynthesis